MGFIHLPFFLVVLAIMTFALPLSTDPPSQKLAIGRRTRDDVVPQEDVLQDFRRIPPQEQLRQIIRLQTILQESEKRLLSKNPPKTLSSYEDADVKDYNGSHLYMRYFLAYWISRTGPEDEIVPVFEIESSGYHQVIDVIEEHSFEKLRVIRAADWLNTREHTERIKQESSWNDVQEESLTKLQRIAFCELDAFSRRYGEKLSSGPAKLEWTKFQKALEASKPRWFDVGNDCGVTHKTLLQRIRDYLSTTWIGRLILKLIDKSS